MSVSKETQQKIQQLQLMEQSMQQFLMQRQNFQSQLAEIDSALKELKKSKEAYKIIGNIMVLSDNEELEKELASKKETAELRIKTIEKQEQKLREKAEDMQKQVLDEIKEQ
ncbi:MAG: prefoldin subunit beta [Candidatus Nanoarchaeia archaeon]|nr:prefoldin subunit beta [Candidatus Nanoarchaeia archaeon]